MISVFSKLGRVSAILVGTFALGVAQNASAVGTASGTNVDNVATVNFEVGGVAQTEIESSPVGNSTPGAGNGTSTSFVVDNVVDLTVVETGNGATNVNPGQTGAVTAFTVTNTGNTTQDYQLLPQNTAAGTVFDGNTDNIQVNNPLAFVDSNGNGTYEAGVDTATFIDSLAADASVIVFFLGDVPIGAINNDVANVRLTVTTADAGSGGATVTTETGGADTPGTVDVVFGDAGNDGVENDVDGYLVSSAQLAIAKTSTVISDPFNGTTDPKAIPGAIMEYVITLTNTGSTDATNIRITDVIDANLTFLPAQYNGNTEDIQVTQGGADSFCSADAGDADADGCGLTGATLEVDNGLIVGTTVGVNDVIVVRFRVTIN
ncbi:MAG: hypothetical protein AAF438_14145 [Pseudomonadota bacterium]